METVKIKAKIKKKLIISRSEMKHGRKFTIDDYTDNLLEKEEKRRPELLDQVFGIAKGVKLYEMLRAERRNDEDRAAKKFSS